MRPALIVTALSVSLFAGGCFSSSSTPSTRARSTASSAAVKGTVEGRVFTKACGGPAAISCSPDNYRGWLAFCETMNEIGPCPSARVDAAGHYRIALKAGRYALIPAPGNGNVVIVKPRWVQITAGRVTTLNINGGSSVK